jgi:hypothetical protein
MLLIAPAACGGDDGPDPEAAKAATATGELVGTTLAKVVAQLRGVLTADPTLTVHQALDRIDAGRASLAEAGYAIDDMLARKGLGLPDMMFLFSEGVASRLPPVAGVVFEPNRRPKYERDYKGDDRRSIMRGYANRAVIRAMFVDQGPPKPFRSLFIGEKPPPSEFLGPNGDIVVPYVDGKGFSAFFDWITDTPIAIASLDQFMDALGF